MQVDKEQTEPVDHRAAWNDGIDADARAAFDEVSKRVRDASRETEQPTESAKPTGDKSAPIETKATEARDGRDEKGRFAPKDTVKAPASSKPETSTTKPEAKTAAVEDKAQPAQTAGGPPPSFSVATKSAWAQLPEHVRADVLKREAEMSQGLAALRDYKDLKPYSELASRHNTTIKAALDNYIGIENLLRRDLASGLAHIAQQNGLSQAQAAQLFAGMAQKLGASSTPGAGSAAGAPAAAADPLLEALRPALEPLLKPFEEKFSKLTQIEQQLAARASADRNAASQSLERSISEFANDPEHTFYADLEEQMAQLFENGMVKRTGNDRADLKTAYDLAARMHPEVSEALIEQRLKATQEKQRQAEQEAAQKARSASRSLTGSRMPGSTVRETTEQPTSNDDVEADVIRAFRQLQHA